MRYLWILILPLIFGCAKKDCAGVRGGNSYMDDCGFCDANASNDNTTCEQDCTGVWGGDAVILWGECFNIEETTYLSLWKSELTGEIPPEIGNLTNLTTVYLDRNQLIGGIPPEIGNLTNLTYLSLAANQLTGEIPPEVCDLIENNNNLHMSYILAGNNLINTCED